MYWVLFAWLAADSIIRDLLTKRISNLVLLINFLFLIKFWNFWLLLLIFMPLLTRWIGAGDLKLIAVLWLYSLALNLQIHSWLMISCTIGIFTAVIFRSKSIPFAPSLIFGLLASDYLARI